MDIQIEHRTADPWDVLDVGGEVDLSTAPTLRARLEQLIDGGTRRLVVNLEPVTFMDSSGLSVLVSAFKAMREADGRIAVVCTNPAISKIFTITGLDRVLAIHPSVDEALSA
ncbi:MAG TPA: STAS domain-containing protein [Actinomycetota bacterium]|jgi:anti-sigma B factor antagonist|nr:STAS domain-containing protein [Actinomycetota bacterium]